MPKVGPHCECVRASSLSICKFYCVNIAIVFMFHCAMQCCGFLYLLIPIFVRPQLSPLAHVLMRWESLLSLKIVLWHHFISQTDQLDLSLTALVWHEPHGRKFWEQHHLPVLYHPAGCPRVSTPHTSSFVHSRVGSASQNSQWPFLLTSATGLDRFRGSCSQKDPEACSFSVLGSRYNVPLRKKGPFYSIYLLKLGLLDLTIRLKMLIVYW